MDKQIEIFLSLALEPHKDYNQSVKDAEKYKRYCTGDGIEKELLQFNRREDEAMFKQRQLLYCALVPSMIGKAKHYFQKPIRRNTGKAVLVAEKDNIQLTKDKVENYNGKPLLDQASDYSIYGNFQDPFSFLVCDFEAFDNKKENAKCFSFIAGAELVWNFKYHCNELEYLVLKSKFKFVKNQDVNYDTERYVGYFPEFNYTLTKYRVKEDIPEGEELVKIKENYYGLTKHNHKLDKVQAIQLGITYGCVIYNNALPMIKDLMMSKSELDLSFKLHNFPQKIQYVERCGSCKGKGSIPVSKDGIQSIGTCTICKGNGRKVHTTASDVIELTLPESGGRNDEEMYDLSKLIHYEGPDVKGLQLQWDYVKGVQESFIQCMFNANIHETIHNTATEVNINFDAIQDSLYTSMRNVEEIYNFMAYCAISFMDIKAELTYKFGDDLKLEDTSDILAQIEASKGNLIVTEKLQQKLVDRVCEGDTNKSEEYEVIERHRLFKDKSEEMLKFVLGQGALRDDDEIRYCFYSQIIEGLRAKNTTWFMQSYETVEGLIAKEIERFKIPIAGPIGGEGLTDIDVEAEAKAKLKGTVGGVQGIIQINQAVQLGQMSEQAAELLLVKIYGFEDNVAKGLIEPLSGTQLKAKTAELGVVD